MQGWTVGTVLAAILVLTSGLSSCDERPLRPERADAPPGAVRILLIGDVMLGRKVARVVTNDPWSIFQDLTYQVRSADIAVANLESPLTTRPHVAETPFELEADPPSARLVASAGFDAVSVANNHAGDAGPEGFTDTLASLEGAGRVPRGRGRCRRRRDADDHGAERRASVSPGSAPGVAWWNSAITVLMQRGLETRGLLTEEQTTLLDRTSLLDFFARIARDELAGRPISGDDNRTLRYIGDRLEEMCSAPPRGPVLPGTSFRTTPTTP